METARVAIKNTYVNCIPFYGVIVSSVQNVRLKALTLSDAVMQTLLYPPENESGQALGDPADAVSVITDASEADTASPAAGQTEDTTAAAEPEKVRYIVSRISAGRPNIFAAEQLKIMERLEAAKSQELNARLAKQIGCLNRLCRSYPGVNYYCYMGARIQETDFYSEIFKQPDSTAQYFRRFVEELDPDYSFDFLRIESPEDRLAKCYRTDHHWNMYGALEGYAQIINMIIEKEPGIEAPFEYDVVKINGIKWFGSCASSTGFNDESYLDDFYMADIGGFPAYKGNGINIKALFKVYSEGNYPKGSYYHDYYSSAFPTQSKYVFPDNDTGRNLLLIGDSYSWSIAHLIARHFDTTICYNNSWNVDDSVKYDYKKIIEDNGITDVVILLYSSRLLFGYDGFDVDNFLAD